MNINKEIILKEKIPLIELKIRNKKYHFLLDTGSSDSILHKKYKDILVEENAKSVSSDTLQTGLGNTEEVEYYELPIFLDDWFMQQWFAFASIDLVDYLSEATGKEVIGIIGMDFLVKTNAFINFKNLKIIYELGNRINDRNLFLKRTLQ